ncbi:MAG: hypothetical protein IKL68_06020 [Clostridia bacterium]|nr:hypothetical protein [Clostridia bacterium]
MDKNESQNNVEKKNENKNEKKKKNIFVRFGGFLISAIVFVAVAFGQGFLEGFVEEKVTGGLESIMYDNAVVGVWETEIKGTEKSKTNLLKNIGLSEKEIELCKKIEYKYVKVHEYDDNGTYKVYYDIDKLKENVEKFYDKAQGVLYLNRKSLHDYYLKNYKIKIKDMSRKEFDNAVAKLYSQKSYEEMLEYFVEIAYDYEKIKNIENGTYTMRKDQIYVTVEGESKEEAIGYKVDNKVTLTLEYLDATEIYTRLK